MIITSNRASAVLCNFLRSQRFNKPFLLPANVCPVVPLSFMKAGVDFEFVDIDDTHAISKHFVKERIGKVDYAGLVFVHAYGKTFDNISFYKEIKTDNPNFCIIDDRCLCPPDLADKQPDYTDLALYSTGYAKYVELSFGGYGLTNMKGIDLANYVYDETEEIKQQTYIKDCLRFDKNYELPADYPWLDGSQIQMSLEQYFEIIKKKIPVVQEQKNKINEIYRSQLPLSIQWGSDYENWRFMISVENRDKVLDVIFEHDLFAGTNFPSVSWMFKNQHCLNAEEESMHVINLFNDFRVNEDFAFKICEVIKSSI